MVSTNGDACDKIWPPEVLRSDFYTTDLNLASVVIIHYLLLHLGVLSLSLVLTIFVSPFPLAENEVSY